MNVAYPIIWAPETPSMGSQILTKFLFAETGIIWYTLTNQCFANSTQFVVSYEIVDSVSPYWINIDSFLLLSTLPRSQKISVIKTYLQNIVRTLKFPAFATSSRIICALNLNLNAAAVYIEHLIKCPTENNYFTADA